MNKQVELKRAMGWKLIPLLFMVGAFLGIRVLGQQGANIEHPKTVIQGSDLIFQITTDKPANIAGNVSVEIAPAEGGESLFSNNPTLMNTKAVAAVTIP